MDLSTAIEQREDDSTAIEQREDDSTAIEQREDEARFVVRTADPLCQDRLVHMGYLPVRHLDGPAGVG
jgi:hypothetical protein